MKAISVITLLFFISNILFAQSASNEKLSEIHLGFKTGYVSQGNLYMESYINGFQPSITLVKNNRHSHSFGLNDFELKNAGFGYAPQDMFSIGMWYQYKLFITKSRLAPYASIGINPVYRYRWFQYDQLGDHRLEVRTPLLFGLNYEIFQNLSTFGETGFNIVHFDNVLTIFNKKNPYPLVPFAQGEINVGLNYRIK